MELRELVKWLNHNSSGIYRPSREAAEVIQELSWALWNVMDGIQDHDIQCNTGLPDSDCNRIADARRKARSLFIP